MAGSHGPDFLADERAESLFEQMEMAAALYGGKRLAEQSIELGRVVAEDPLFRKDDQPYMGRAELFDRAMEKAGHVIAKQRELQLGGSGGADEELYTLWRFVDNPLPIGLNLGMFIPAIEGQGTEAQAAQWLPPARASAIIGCYAQTEMGHGSNVQGLETIAEYDMASQEFDIHSPTLTSTKWWPGGLGKASTHALVYARLLLKGEDRGIHAFIVPLRDLETHEPLPGITVGDMGPKFGYNTMDNGFLRLHHVRIPRENMLMRYAEVSPNGEYTRKGQAKLAYGAMVLVRANLVRDAGFALAKAVTIAVRYSAVRRQGGAGEGGKETKILDYPTQQQRVLPLLASSYAYFFLGRWMMALYRRTMERFAAGDYASLPEVHACTAGLKALTTQLAADGIEECRRRCGGNGYLHASGLPDLYASYVPAVTFEGDNIILFLQVARFLVKAAGQAVSGAPLNGTVEYFNQWESLLSHTCGATSAEDFLDPQLQVTALSVRSVKLVFRIAKALSQAEDPIKEFEASTVALVRAAKAHCQLIAVQKFLEAVREGEFSGRGVTSHLQMLSSLYSLSLMDENMGDLLEVEYLKPVQAELLREQMRKLLRKVRKSAVQLVDAFHFSDHYLGSAIGRHDGDVYGHLLASAQREPLNASNVVPGIKYLKAYIGKKIDIETKLKAKDALQPMARL